MITWLLLAASRSAVFPSSRFTASHYAVPTNPLDVSAVGTTVITTSQVLRDQNYSFTLPTTPKYSSTTNLGGLVRYATTGASTQTASLTSFSGSTTALAAETNVAARKPVLLGFTFDGYGIYDNVAMNGKTIGVSSLDSCNGIFSPVPGYPRGVYHYVPETVKSDRSSPGCYHGVARASRRTEPTPR
jgi:hypothetical protein